MAFQSGDSATLSAYRGKGIFTKMVNAGVSAIPHEAFIYGFPNNNSLPAFIKMGWNVGERKKYKILSEKDVSFIDLIDEKYLMWLISEFTSLSYCMYKGSILLIKKRKWNIYQVLGRIDHNNINAIGIRRINNKILFCYSVNGKIGNGMVDIWIGSKKVNNIPIYKMDTALTF